MKDNLPPINQRLADVMASKKITQSNVAERTGKSIQSIFNWVRSGVTIPADMVAPLCQACGITEHYLLTGEEEKPIESLTEDQLELLNLYSEMDRESRVQILAMAYTERQRSRSRTKLQEDAS